MRYTDKQIVGFLREAVSGPGGVRRFSKCHDFSTSFIYLVLRGEAPPGARIGKILGFRTDDKKWIKLEKKVPAKKVAPKKKAAVRPLRKSRK